MEPANRDKEVEIYKGLESLWGVSVPSLFAFGAFSFLMHWLSIILTYCAVLMLLM
jgi:hypothetical protein